MARVELPSGAWVEYRDKLLAIDKFTVQSAIKVEMDATTNIQVYSGGIQNQMRNALLLQVITAWSFEGIPIPSASPSGSDIIGSTMDIDDYDALSEAVEPMLVKVFNVPNRRASTS